MSDANSFVQQRTNYIDILEDKLKKLCMRSNSHVNLQERETLNLLIAVQKKKMPKESTISNLEEIDSEK